MLTFPYNVPTAKVTQPLGVYYVAILPAELLLAVSFSDRVRAEKSGIAGYKLQGTQRGISVDRLKAIAEYIDRYDSAFPNSIILAGNYREEDGLIEQDDSLRWSVYEQSSNGNIFYSMNIPTHQRLAAIIDGQHRLFAFTYATHARLATGLICSVFLDLPKPFQAQIFATINSTQRPVDKSLTYELFGYNIAEEEEGYWSPDKLAVFLARKLNMETDSPLSGRIIVAPENEFSIDVPSSTLPWKISMATVVEGIVQLISTNPKRDTNQLLTPRPNKRVSLSSTRPKDKSILRQEYITGNDQLIYLVVRNFLTAADKVFWTRTQENSFIVKTAGVQALFEVLRKIAGDALAAKNVSADYFIERLTPASGIDFALPEYRNSSAAGRGNIRKAIEEAIGVR
jgi:DNA phosphorothioation-associated DGQHR protein 1